MLRFERMEIWSRTEDISWTDRENGRYPLNEILCKRYQKLDANIIIITAKSTLSVRFVCGIVGAQILGLFTGDPWSSA